MIDRLSLYPRLRDQVRQTREKETNKPWLIAEGFQPVGKSDNPARAETIQLPSKHFVEATSSKLDLFLLPDDCAQLSSASAVVRNRSNKGVEVFRAPHVLIAQGFTSIAFADFDVSFQHSLRGITGPKKDRELLMFLAAYLRSSLAKYFLFHTSSNWGVSRQKVHVEELLRLPFPLPDVSPDPRRSWKIVEEVAKIVTTAASEAAEYFVDREGIVRVATDSIDALIDEYFDILPIEKALVDDTIQVIIPSVRPTRARRIIPTIAPSTTEQRGQYIERICDTLNGWAKGGPFVVQGYTTVSEKLGVGVAILRKARSDKPPLQAQNSDDLVAALDRLRKTTENKLNTFELMRGAKVFERDRLYVVKPIGRRFWTETAALNDADEIAGTILMNSSQGVV